MEVVATPSEHAAALLVSKSIAGVGGYRVRGRRLKKGRGGGRRRAGALTPLEPPAGGV